MKGLDPGSPILASSSSFKISLTNRVGLRPSDRSEDLHKVRYGSLYNLLGIPANSTYRLSDVYSFRAKPSDNLDF